MPEEARVSVTLPDINREDLELVEKLTGPVDFDKEKDWSHKRLRTRLDAIFNQGGNELLQQDIARVLTVFFPQDIPTDLLI